MPRFPDEKELGRSVGSKGGRVAGAQWVGEVKEVKGVKGVDEVRVWGWEETSSRGN